MTLERENTNMDRESRDLLIEMRTQIVAIRADIKDLKDGTSATLSDHETRIRAVEVKTTRVMTYGSAALVLLGIIEALAPSFLR